MKARKEANAISKSNELLKHMSSVLKILRKLSPDKEIMRSVLNKQLEYIIEELEL